MNGTAGLAEGQLLGSPLFGDPSSLLLCRYRWLGCGSLLGVERGHDILAGRFGGVPRGFTAPGLGPPHELDWVVLVGPVQLRTFWDSPRQEGRDECRKQFTLRGHRDQAELSEKVQQFCKRKQCRP